MGHQAPTDSVALVNARAALVYRGLASDLSKLLAGHILLLTPLYRPEYLTEEKDKFLQRGATWKKNGWLYLNNCLPVTLVPGLRLHGKVDMAALASLTPVPFTHIQRQ